MNEQEIERCLERFTMGKTTDVMNFDYAGTLAYIQRLKSENAALRERLDKAVEIPDYVFECINGKVERIFTEYLTVGELKNLEANGYSLTKEAAEARLAELKGGKE